MITQMLCLMETWCDVSERQQEVAGQSAAEGKGPAGGGGVGRAQLAKREQQKDELEKPEAFLLFVFIFGQTSVSLSVESSGF